MATRRRAPVRRKAATKRKASRRGGKRKPWLNRKIRNGLKRMVKRTHKVREAKRQAEQKAHVSRNGAKTVTTAPVAGWATLMALLTDWFSANQADRDSGKAATWADRADTAARRRLDRHSTFLCYGHVEPQRFATAAELNAHLETGHPEEPVHDIGSVAKPVRNIIPPTRPPSRPRRGGAAGARPRREGSGTRGTTAAHNLAGEAMATLGDIGSAKIASVSQIKDIAAAIEKIALQFEEAIEGFQKNGQTSEEAPIDAGVLAQLDSAKAGAEQIQAAAVAFVAAFDEYYSQDIQEAQQGERMSNDALVK